MPDPVFNDDNPPAKLPNAPKSEPTAKIFFLSSITEMELSKMKKVKSMRKRDMVIIDPTFTPGSSSIFLFLLVMA